jgi:hypothetical protein
MIPSTDTRKLIQKAQLTARSILGGGFKKKLNDLESYKSTGAVSGGGFLVQHIPVFGPSLGKAYETAANAGINKLYEKWLAESKTPKQRLTNSLFVLERYLCASIRQAYNTLADYIDKASPGVSVRCNDCQDAFKEATAAYLAQDCVDDLKKALAIVDQLAKDLRTEIDEAGFAVNQIVSKLDRRIDNFRGNHPDKSCRPPGVQECYWIPGPQITPFSSFRPKNPPATGFENG